VGVNVSGKPGFLHQFPWLFRIRMRIFRPPVPAVGIFLNLLVEILYML